MQIRTSCGVVGRETVQFRGSNLSDFGSDSASPNSVHSKNRGWRGAGVGDW